LEFDPTLKGTDFSPLSPDAEAMLKTSLKANILTDVQKTFINDQVSAYQERYKVFAQRWEAFKAAPGAQRASDEFLESLDTLSNDGMNTLAFAGELFYTREQRIALREQGITIEGKAFGGESDGKRETHLEHYPIEEFVSRWNTMPNYLGLSPERPRLK